MAKISLSKLGLKKNEDVAILHWGEGENQIDIEIKQYLSIDDKFKIMADIINQSIDEYNFYNPVRVESLYFINVIDAYTNIKLPVEKNEETGVESYKDPSKTYDLLVSSGIKDDIFAAIPNSELSFIYTGVFNMIESVYKYNNSALGLLNTLMNQYEGMDQVVENLSKNLSDPENMGLLKDVITKLG